MNKNYINYHSHSHMSNVITPDSTISNQERANRTIELNQKVLGGIEHGFLGRPIEIIELSKKYNLKPLLGVETYFVPNKEEKDRTNAHLIFLAKNEDGRKDINWAISRANIEGYYYRARMDFDIIQEINPNNVWVTSACLGGVWKYENSDEIILKLKDLFGLNFFLEVQTHNVQPQKELNQKIINLSKKYNIKMIAGMDSHMITEKQSKDRDDYLLSRGISYDDEKGWFLDFPSYDEAFKRFEKQGVLNKNQISEGLDNTNIFEEVEEYNSIIFNNSIIKLPTIYPGKSQEEKNKIFSNLVWNSWNEEKNNVPKEKHEHYKIEIEKELSTIIDTHVSDYFLLNHEVVKKGKELGGSMTLTSRGSSPSFYITKLLGLTTIDRISASVKMFPERFISKERLLETKSLPDFDWNLGTPKIFGQAQVDIMGEGRSYPMIAFGTTKNLSAWKLYARSAGIDFDISNHVSEQLTQFEFDQKHLREDDEELNVLDYIDKELYSIFLESRKYIGLVNSLTIHPCAWLIGDFDIRREFGLIKIKTGNVENICCCCDGLFAEQYKLLKNDLLKVSVVDLIYRVYDRIGIKPHPLPELLKLCENDEKVWSIYKNACGMGINQIEQPGTIGRVAKYAPRNISEVSAFVSAIRPGFKSNYKQFEAREKFEYGIPTLDKLIQTEEFPQSYMLYQENAMQVMAYAGIPIHETYEVIKNIAKKRYEKVIAYKEKFTSGMKKKLINDEKVSMRDAEEISNKTWQIIEDSSRYSFNASHAYSVAGDSLYGAWLKANYPYEFYEVFLQMLEDDADKERLAKTKIEAEKYFGIKFPPYRFGQDNRGIIADKKNKKISSSLKSIKTFNHKISEELYQSAQKSYNTFTEFLIDAEDNGYISLKFEKLIKIKYFEQFGNNKKLLTVWQEFKKGKNRYEKKLSDKSKEKRIPALIEMEKNIPNENLSFREQILAEQEILEHIQAVYPNVDKKYIYIMDLNDKYAPRIQAYSINNGTQSTLKIYKAQFANKPFGFGDILYCKSFEKKFAVKYVDGEYLENKEQVVWWLTDYNVIDNVDKIIGS